MHILDKYEKYNSSVSIKNVISEKIAIYSRKSKYTGKGESVENQIELCKEYIRTHYNNANILIYEDEGFSGKNTDRPQFKKMMKDAKNKVFSAIICYRLDRISRNVADFSILITDLNDLGIGFISIKEQFDTTTPMGRAMMYIASVFSQLEREVIAERVRDNMLELAKSGRWLGGTTPTGYKSEGYEKISIDGKPKKVYKLVPIEEERKIVELIFNKYIELKSQTKLETYLIQNNIKTKLGKDFARFAIKSILNNPVYAKNDKAMYDYFINNKIDIFADESDFDGKAGVIAYNRTEQAKGKSNKQREMSEWIISVGKHPGFISGEDWIKAQDRLKAQEDMRYRLPRTNKSLLSGILRCSHCGSCMRPKLSPNKDKDGSSRFYYMCELKEKSRGQKCNVKNLNGNEVDRIVLDTIKNLTSENSEIYIALKKLANTVDEVEEKQKVEIKSLKQTINKNKADIDTYLEKIKFIESEFVADIMEKVKTLKLANEKIEKELYKLNEKNKNQISDQETAKLVLSILDNYFDVFGTIDVLKQRDMIKLLVSDVTSDGENLTINLLNAKGLENSDKKFPISGYSK